MEFSCSLRLLGSSLGMWKRRAELEYKTEHSVYNVKICFLKKEKRTTYAKSLCFGFDLGGGGCFKKAKGAPPILNPRGHRALSSKYHTILYLEKYAAPPPTKCIVPKAVSVFLVFHPGKVVSIGRDPGGNSHHLADLLFTGIGTPWSCLFSRTTPQHISLFFFLSFCCSFGGNIRPIKNSPRGSPTAEKIEGVPQ